MVLIKSFKKCKTVSFTVYFTLQLLFEDLRGFDRKANRKIHFHEHKFHLKTFLQATTLKTYFNNNTCGKNVFDNLGILFTIYKVECACAYLYVIVYTLLSRKLLGVRSLYFVPSRFFIKIMFETP